MGVGTGEVMQQGCADPSIGHTGPWRTLRPSPDRPCAVCCHGVVLKCKTDMPASALSPSQAVILAAPDLETRRALVGLVFNGVATPDPSQRGAVVGLCARVAAALGPGWAAQEVLSMAVKQVGARGGQDMQQALGG
jgi:hypothetical protein